MAFVILRMQIEEAVDRIRFRMPVGVESHVVLVAGLSYQENIYRFTLPHLGLGAIEVELCVVRKCRPRALEAAECCQRYKHCQGRSECCQS